MTETHAWNEKLDLGHEGMDREHHLQIALVSAIGEAVEQGRPWMARKLSNQLVGYSTAHFGSEELLMEASRYGALDAHAGEHRVLLSSMRDLQRAIAEDDAALALGSALELRTSLAGHISGADRRLAAYSEGAGTSGR
jgi:hemerythrin